MEKKILKAIEEAYRKGLKDAEGLNDIRPYLLTSQVVAHELANKFCQPLVVKQSEQLKCGNSSPPCAPNTKFGILECTECNWSE